MMQVFNLLNSRRINDEYNIFEGECWVGLFLAGKAVGLVGCCLFVGLQGTECCGCCAALCCGCLVSIQVCSSGLPNKRSTWQLCVCFVLCAGLHKSHLFLIILAIIVTCQVRHRTCDVCLLPARVRRHACRRCDFGGSLWCGLL